MAGVELSAVGVELTQFPLAPSFAFAALPASPRVGTVAVVTDSDTAVWGDTIAGSGANVVLGWFNGSDWTVIGA